jgi:hypothetical protein
MFLMTALNCLGRMCQSAIIKAHSFPGDVLSPSLEVFLAALLMLRITCNSNRHDENDQADNADFSELIATQPSKDTPTTKVHEAPRDTMSLPSSIGEKEEAYIANPTMFPA